MDTTILQIPMAKSLKLSAQEVANDYGFSSLQDLLRVILTKLSRRELVVSIENTVQLSKKNDSRYSKMSKDFVYKNNIKSFFTVNDLMKNLRS
jgi:hypothetical protein